MDSSNADEYYVTALQIFEYCGAESSGTLRVDSLMDKFAPFIKTNKAEYSYLKSLLDPEQENPEISVTKLATALHKYSESQKCKVDLDESFNLRCGQAPQDSDSGISTDGFQLLEDLQCELREKAHLAYQLRNQLDFTDRQHEEALATLSSERDALQVNLNMLREENIALSHLRQDYEEACDRLLGSDRALCDTRAELDGYKKRNKVLHEQVSTLENEKLSLQELLSKSKEECHRINEMYASRQSALLEQNEALKTDHGDLAARLQDQDEFMQQLIKEKVLLEMELKDMLNKSNQTQLRMDRSIEISYTEDQMLTALDSLNADSRFSQDNRLLDEESFVNALKEDQGRSTNMSLFDEIRLSFSHNMSRHNLTDSTPYDKCNLDLSTTTAETQTDVEVNTSYVTHMAHAETQTDTEISSGLSKEKAEIGIQTEVEMNTREVKVIEHVGIQTDIEISIGECKEMVVIGVQTDVEMNTREVKDVEHVGSQTDVEINSECKNVAVMAVQTDKIVIREVKETLNVGVQTEIGNCECSVSYNVHTQTEDLYNNNNNNESCLDCSKCTECELLKKTIHRLETENTNSHHVLKETQEELSIYEDNLTVLQKLVSDGKGRNSFLQAAVDNLQTKIMSLEVACSNQREIIEGFSCEMCCSQIKTDCDVNSVGTQVETACSDCEKRSAGSHRGVRRYFWDAVKCMFQVFAVVCFACAVVVLYGISRPRPDCRAPREPLPWRWLQAQDLMDLLLRIEYVADVPM